MFPSIELSWGILTRLIERLNQLSGLSTPLSNSPVISANFLSSSSMPSTPAFAAVNPITIASKNCFLSESSIIDSNITYVAAAHNAVATDSALCHSLSLYLIRRL